MPADVEVVVDTSVLAGDAQLEASYLPCVSTITIGELYLGVLSAKSERIRVNRLARYHQVVAHTNVVAVDERVAQAYASIRQATGRRPTNDLWIAATAVACGYPLVTADKPQAQLEKTVPELDVIYIG